MPGPREAAELRRREAPRDRGDRGAENSKFSQIWERSFWVVAKPIFEREYSRKNDFCKKHWQSLIFCTKEFRYHKTIFGIFSFPGVDGGLAAGFHDDRARGDVNAVDLGIEHGRLRSRRRTPR